jgi:hypothetical protein
VVLTLRMGHAFGAFIVTDTSNNIYALAVTRANPNDADDQLYIYYAQKIAGGPDTVTVSFNTLAGGGGAHDPTIRMAVLEYSGIAASDALDQTSSAMGTGTAVSSGTVATTQANELLIGVGANSNGIAWTPGAGWVLRDEPANKLADEDQIVNSTATTSAMFTLAASDVWIAAIATFRGQ